MEDMDNDQESKVAKAKEFLNKAHKLHMDGRVDEAIELYERSIEFHPTAEAHTFMGWAFSHHEDYERAIEECKIAIELDPEFGNPYNDIGVYLIEMGRYDEAEGWFEQAIAAPRYASPHYPRYNLGRVYERQGRWFEAVKMFKNAYDLNPKYKIALTASVRLQAALN